MIKIENLSYSFPQKDLYNNISFTLDPGEHCAFIGISGCGKSTLVDLMLDPEKYMYDGSLEIDPHCIIGYVSQFSKPEKIRDVSVEAYISEEFFKIQKELACICLELETSLDVDPLLEKYQLALDAFDRIGGDSFESNRDKKLNLANLMKHKDLNVTQLSGGEFKLVQVMKEMLDNPDCLIMDEPDVFLDFENLNGLKKLINSHKGMILVITHNRYLLNHCFNKIIHLENMELQEFNGSYIDYNFSLLESKIELQELASIDTAEIERNEILIDKLRMIASYKSNPACGKALNARVKLLERLEARRIKPPFVAIKQPNIHLVTENEIAETTAINIHDYSVSFDDILLENIDLELQSTDKVALIGANGTGKTTLLKAIFANNNEAIKLDENIELAYLSQLQNEMLDESNTIIQEFLDLGFKTYQDVRSYISEYGFSKKNAEQEINSLSGGEKNILQLAKVSTTKANFLLLDEPTSHLDTYSQMALEKAITEYNGGILMISHDFYTIANCMDFVLIIENKTIRKMSIRKFRKTIYAHHFDRDYLALEQKKKEMETKIAFCLEDDDFEQAKILCADLKKIIDSM